MLIRVLIALARGTISAHGLSIRDATPANGFDGQGKWTDQSSQAATAEPDSNALIGRGTLAVTIGNMLEFYDFITYSFFAIQIGHTFFPVEQPVRQPDAVAGDVRRGLCHPADRRHRDRVLFRSRGPASGDDPELCHDGVRHHRAGADAVLCHASASPRPSSPSSRAWCRDFRSAARSARPRPI